MGESYHTKALDEELGERKGFKLWAFSLQEASRTQKEAIREFAISQGYKDLNLFWKWQLEHDKDYYDIIKIKSP